MSILVIGMAESWIISAHSRAQEDGAVRLREDRYAIRWVRVPDHPALETLERLNRDDPHALRDMMYAAFEASLHADGVDRANAAAAEDGVRAVVFTCNFYGPSIAGLGEDASKFPVPVINPLVCAATYAQHLMDSTS